MTADCDYQRLLTLWRPHMHFENLCVLLYEIAARDIFVCVLLLVCVACVVLLSAYAAAYMMAMLHAKLSPLRALLCVLNLHSKQTITSSHKKKSVVRYLAVLTLPSCCVSWTRSCGSWENTINSLALICRPMLSPRVAAKLQESFHSKGP